MPDTQLKDTIKDALVITGAYTGLAVVYEENSAYKWQYSGNPAGSRPVAVIRDGSLSAIANTATPEETTLIREELNRPNP